MGTEQLGDCQNGEEWIWEMDRDVRRLILQRYDWR